MEMYNTGNPVGSTAPKDLSDNAQVFDRISVGTDPWVLSRLGQKLWSLYGMNYEFNNAQLGREAAFQQFLADAAFVWIGDYGPGLTFTNRSQYVLRDGVPYRLAPTTTVPYTTTGNWATEVENFSPINSDDVLRQDLAAAGGSARVGFVAAGSDTVPRTVEGKLRDLVSRADYSTDAAFEAAQAGRPSIDADGNFRATVVPAGGGAPVGLGELAEAVKDPTISRQFLFGPRPVLRYRDAGSVRVHAFSASMGEFRFMGQFTAPMGRVLPLPAQTASVIGTGLGAESAFRTENWYAAFAVAAESGSSAVIKTMPFLRVGSVAGNKVTLNKAGERIHTVQPQTYAWLSPNNLEGCKCLVVSEGGRYSGRVTTATLNDAGSITLADAGTLAFGDFILPAPPGFSEFGYLGSFYMDTAEVRNLYDDGRTVRSRGTYILSPATNGKVETWLGLNAGGYISPLATAVVVESSFNISTSSTGFIAEYFAGDSGNHTLFTMPSNKQAAASYSEYHTGIEIPFLYPYTFYYSNAGTEALLTNRVSSQMNIRGGVEP